MKNKLKNAVVLIILTAVLVIITIKISEKALPSPQLIDGKALNKGVQVLKNVEINKEFLIKFSSKVNIKSIKMIDVLDGKGNKVGITAKIKNNTMSILPPKQGYEYGQKYKMQILKVKSHWYSVGRKKQIINFSTLEIGEIVRPVDGKIEKIIDDKTIVCTNNSPVFAVLPGNVEEMNYKEGTLLINHNNGLKSKYYKMKNFIGIKIGQQVYKGQLLGKAKDEIKFELTKNSQKISMNKYIKFAQEEKYILANEDIILKNRAVTFGGVYKVIDENVDKYFISIGSSKDWILKENAAVFDKKPKEKNTLGWCYVSNEKGIKKLLDNKDYYCNLKSSTSGIKIISPTWFYVSGNVNKPSTIGLNSIGSTDFSKIAHNNGYLVWGLVSNVNNNGGENSTKAIPRTKYILKSSEERKKLEDKIVAYGKQYDLDGINIDFEGFGDGEVVSTRDNFSLFIKELHEKLIKENIKLSVDVTISDGSLQFSKCYDRKAITTNADYVIVMLYDQHWQGSKEAGSVGSYKWSENSMLNTLKEVDNKKFIVGIPLYGREYIMDKSQKVIKDKVLTVSEMKVIENKKGAIKDYDKVAKQNVIRYIGTDGNSHIFWQENLDTIKWRTELSKENDTVGIGAWQLNPYEDNETKKIIMEGFNHYLK